MEQVEGLHESQQQGLIQCQTEELTEEQWDKIIKSRSTNWHTYIYHRNFKLIF